MEEEFVYQALRDPADVIDVLEEKKKKKKKKNTEGKTLWGCALQA
jgi:hypothetical protein